MTAALHLRSISAVSAKWSGVNVAEPEGEARVDWFDANTHLGRKGHRYYSPPTKYALSAILQAPDFSGGTASGIYLGSSSADTEHRRSIASKLGDNDDDLPGAASALSASLSAPAGTIAKRYAVHGPVVTLAGGDDSALVCLWSAANAARRGEISLACIGQVEHQPGVDASDGAVVWLATTEDDEDAVATVAVNGWAPFDPGDTGALLEAIKGGDGPVTILSALGESQDEALACALLNEFDQERFEIVSTQEIEDLVAEDLRPFSLLSLLILKGIGGSILVLSGNGHLFNLTVTSKRKSHA